MGALLWDSGRVRNARGWLRPCDLNHGKARAIYQILTGLDHDGRSVPVMELPAVAAGAGKGILPVTAPAPDPILTGPARSFGASEGADCAGEEYRREREGDQ